MVNQRLIVRAPKTEQLYHKFEKKQRANYCLNLRKRTVRISDNSSNVNEVIRAVLNFFFYEKISHAQKAQNGYKRTKTKKAAFVSA